MKILVTGSDGLCGRAIREESLGSAHEFYFSTRQDGDLKNGADVAKLFEKIKPDSVIHTAARVGGMGGNVAMPCDFFYENILINAHVIQECVNHSVKKLLAFSSVCVFSDDLPLVEESAMHDGPAFASNSAYAYAKRMVDIHISSAIKQYGVSNYSSIIPGNTFGKGDMFSVDNGHIIPALMHKIYLCIQNNTPLTVWGDGKSFREFIYVNDLARALISLLEMEKIPERLIVSSPHETSIKEIVDTLTKVTGFSGKIEWDTTKPNGQRGRPTSKTLFNSLFPEFIHTPLEEGLRETWGWFKDSYPNIRTLYN
jgi:GDP-L-fucose synthase